jgi:hypothetical protein
MRSKRPLVRPAYFLIDLDFWSILISDIVTKKGEWYDYFNPVTFICAFPMQRAFVKVLIFHYGFCPIALEKQNYKTSKIAWGTSMTSWTFLINCRNWRNWIIYIWDTNQSFHTRHIHMCLSYAKSLCKSPYFSLWFLSWKGSFTSHFSVCC